jgi:hypothetical protein
MEGGTISASIGRQNAKLACAQRSPEASSLGHSKFWHGLDNIQNVLNIKKIFVGLMHDVGGLGLGLGGIRVRVRRHADTRQSSGPTCSSSQTLQHDLATDPEVQHDINVASSCA